MIIMLITIFLHIAYLFHLYMYNIVQKIIKDPINNVTSIPVIINSVGEVISLLMLVVAVGVMIEELFKGDIITVENITELADASVLDVLECVVGST